MAPSLMDLGQRLVLWAMATLASVHAGGNAIQSFMLGQADLGLLWAGITVFSFFIGFQAERIKVFLEEFRT